MHCKIMYRHTLTTPSSQDIDAAAMEFERRFHISVDASEDREQQVWYICNMYTVRSVHTNTCSSL